MSDSPEYSPGLGSYPEPLDESVDRKLEPVKEDVAELKEDGRTNRILLRAMARHMLPKEVLAELGEEAAP